ncbi:hypothetical protein PoB_003097900 [Plakobranchus ocellatus]|uniref:PiggyBac transposable element-derived protein domain-containing protein n=1 Tax=Plakobranchus ocellatus TaxID=259542 RepID=A0AAV4A9W7_9GAST|nr:hypothetical protein PoB_003097900 [Plakobranchus ocellatus]
MGLIGKKTLASYWTTRPSQATLFFNTVMNYDEFVLISRMVHLNDIAREIERGHEGHDPWSKCHHATFVRHLENLGIATPLDNDMIVRSRAMSLSRGCTVDVGVTQFWRKNNGGMLALAFRDKKSKLEPVLALSTAHKAGVE